MRRIDTDYPEDAPRCQVQRALETLDVPERTRVARCVLFAADGDPDKFRQMVELAQLDYRDAIMCGEYEYEAGSARRVRSPISPFT